MRAKVEDVLNEVRSDLQGHGGDVELVDVNEETGEVRVKLTGACAGCPMSQLTLQMGIERQLKAKIPEVKSVVNVNMPDAGAGE